MRKKITFLFRELRNYFRSQDEIYKELNELGVEYRMSTILGLGMHYSAY